MPRKNKKNVTGMTDNEIGRKDDRADNKPMWELLPMETIEDVVKVFTFGANKYAPNNWKNLENGKDRYYAAAMRHIVAWRKGERLDKETGLTHLSHALCDLVIVAELDKK